MELDKYSTPNFFKQTKLNLKQIHCPHCRVVGFLLLHGYLRGFQETLDIVKKGRRIFCSNRYSKNGCGKTFSIYFLPYQPYIRATTKTIWHFFFYIISGFSIEKAYREFESWIKLSLWSFLRIWSKFKSNLSHIRSVLSDNFILEKNTSESAEIETLKHIQFHLQDNHFNPFEKFLLSLQKNIL